MSKVAKPKIINVNTGKIIIDLETNINFIIEHPVNYNMDCCNLTTLWAGSIFMTTTVIKRTNYIIYKIKLKYIK